MDAAPCQHSGTDLRRHRDQWRRRRDLRDAHVRDFHILVLADGCAAFSQSAHEASIAALATISEIATVDEMVAANESGT